MYLLSDECVLVCSCVRVGQQAVFILVLVDAISVSAHVHPRPLGAASPSRCPNTEPCRISRPQMHIQRILPPLPPAHGIPGRPKWVPAPAISAFGWVQRIRWVPAKYRPPMRRPPFDLIAALGVDSTSLPPSLQPPPPRSDYLGCISCMVLPPSGSRHTLPCISMRADIHYLPGQTAIWLFIHAPGTIPWLACSYARLAHATRDRLTGLGSAPSHGGVRDGYLKQTLRCLGTGSGG